MNAVDRCATFSIEYDAHETRARLLPQNKYVVKRPGRAQVAHPWHLLDKRQSPHAGVEIESNIRVGHADLDAAQCTNSR
jgi:hypothetical protein